MNMATGFDRRHPRSVILIRVLVTAWLLALTGILLAYGYWGWALLTLAGAVANIVLGLSRLPGDNALDPHRLSQPITLARRRERMSRARTWQHDWG